jgi:hypothetical protein
MLTANKISNLGEWSEFEPTHYPKLYQTHQWGSGSLSPPRLLNYSFYINSTAKV